MQLPEMSTVYQATHQGKGGSIYPEIKLDVHVLSKPAGVVIPECFGIAKSLV